MWILFAILGAAATAATGTLTKAGLEKVSPTLALAIQAVVVLVATWIAALLSGGQAEVAGIERRSWIILLVAGLTTSGAYLLYFKALSMGASSTVQPVDRLSLVFAILFAALFLKEKVTPQIAIGAALMAVGAVMIAVGGPKE